MKIDKGAVWAKYGEGSFQEVDDVDTSRSVSALAKATKVLFSRKLGEFDVDDLKLYPVHGTTPLDSEQKIADALA